MTVPPPPREIKLASVAAGVVRRIDMDCGELLPLSSPSLEDVEELLSFSDELDASPTDFCVGCRANPRGIGGAAVLDEICNKFASRELEASSSLLVVLLSSDEADLESSSSDDDVEEELSSALPELSLEDDEP